MAPFFDNNTDVCLEIHHTLTWAGQVSLRVSGDMARPHVEGAAQLSKAALVCPWTRYPVSNLSATVRLADNALKARPDVTCSPAAWANLLGCIQFCLNLWLLLSARP